MKRDCSLSLSLSLSLFLSPLHTHTLSLSLSLSYTHTHTHTHSLSFTHTHTLCLTRALQVRKGLLEAVGKARCAPSDIRSASLSPSLYFTHTHTHIHTLSYTHSHPTHPHTLSLQVRKGLLEAVGKADALHLIYEQLAQRVTPLRSKIEHHDYKVRTRVTLLLSRLELSYKVYEP